MLILVIFKTSSIYIFNILNEIRFIFTIIYYVFKIVFEGISVDLTKYQFIRYYNIIYFGMKETVVGTYTPFDVSFFSPYKN